MLPILSTEQMRRWEEDSWKTGIDQKSVIEQAGRAVGKEISSLLSLFGGRRVLVLAGKGHNGDDARVAADFLKGSCEVQLINVQDPVAGLQELNEALKRVPAPEWIVDGLFGIGLNRPLSSEWVELIRAINGASQGVISVDIPSGLDEEGRGCPEAVQANYTLTLGAPKSCLVQGTAPAYTGKIKVLATIGLAPCQETSEVKWVEKTDFEQSLFGRALSSHKGSYGHLLILAGSLGYHGAAVLAAQGACAGRPGLISVCTMPDVYIPIASQLRVQMVHPWEPGWKIPENVSAIVVGPGLAAANIPDEFWDWVEELWQRARIPVIADASALGRLSTGREMGLRVITPHPGEAARNLRMRSGAEVQRDRISALRRHSLVYGNATVVLKGHQTLIGESRGPLLLNPTGTPGMAQGGTGDVLAGFLGGLLAHPDAAQKEVALRRIAYGVYRHGEVAERLEQEVQRELREGNGQGRSGWTAEDLAREL